MEKHDPPQEGARRSGASTQTTRSIHATPEAVYHAFVDPIALGVWLAPGEMTGRVHAFELKVDGGYQMSLYYPETEREARGKTAAREDRFSARFIELTPPIRIVEEITFDSPAPEFAGPMTMKVTLLGKADGTEVTVVFENLPPGIRPEDNDLGTRLALAKLAGYLERSQSAPLSVRGFD